jgi:hypothetical protein
MEQSRGEKKNSDVKVKVKMQEQSHQNTRPTTNVSNSALSKAPWSMTPPYLNQSQPLTPNITTHKPPN